MSDAHATEGHHDDAHGHGDHEHHYNYPKIYFVLLALLVVSIIGPEVAKVTGLKIITLITAFGIAVVKAWLVIKYFMHVTVDPKIVGYLLATALAFMFLFFAGVAPDVMKHEGQRWENKAAEMETHRAQAAAKAAPAHGDHAKPAEEKKH